MRRALWCVAAGARARRRRTREPARLALPSVGLRARDIAVVVNDADPASVEVGRYYAAKRGIAADRVVHVRFPPGQPVMTFADFLRVQAVLDAKVGAEVQAYALAWTLPYRVECMSVTAAFALGFDPGAYCAEGCLTTKPYLFDVDVVGAPQARESAAFSYGAKAQVITLNGWKIGLSICYDLRFSELYSKYAQKNVDVILVPSAFLVPTGKAHWHSLLRARAIESQAFIVAAAQSGDHQNANAQHRYTYGHSLVVDPWGVVLKDLETPGADLAVVELDSAQLKKVREQIPMAKHRRL